MFYNKILEHIILPIGDFLNGSCVIKELKYWRKICSFSEEDINNLSIKKLNDLLTHATNNITFYKSYKNNRPIDTIKWLKMFPIMYKKDIKENINDLTAVKKEKLIEEVSSGSTGERSIVYKSKKDISKGRALILLIWGWAGFYPGKPLLQTGMTPQRGIIKKLKDILFRTKYYDAFNLNDGEIKILLQKLNKKSNYHIVGYASSLYVLAETYLRLGLSNVKFDKAISLGDKMFPHYRKKIKAAFGCDVIDTYGLSEGLTIAAQKDLEYYYILTPHVYIEILDSQGKEVNDGELGFVVATSLDAFMMPLIRYYTGDLAIKLPHSKYPKNRQMNFPLLEKIIGRDTDIVRTKTGKQMIVHFFTGIFEHISEIKQFKVVQHNLDEIEIEYIPSDNFTKDILLKIENKIHLHLEEKFPIIWRKVETISPTASGKPQIIQSFLKIR